jgi:ABC-2 type transport system permease protein
VAANELAAAVRIPGGYSERLLNGQTIDLEVVADQNTLAGQTASTALETAANRLLGAVETAQLSADTLAQEVGFETGAERDAYLEQGLAQAISAWDDPPLTVRVERATGLPAGKDTPGTTSGFAQASAGMIVQFAVFGLITSAMILVLERKNKVLQRLLTTPIRRTEVIAGHTLAMFLVVFVQEVILVLLGQYAFGVNYLRQPGATLLMMLGLALWAASLGLLIGAISQKEDQVIVLSLIAMFVFAAMGGAWFPLEVTGKTFAAIGHIMPTAWAMDGFQNIIMRGLSFSSVLVPAGILAVYSALFFALAVWRFRFE